MSRATDKTLLEDMLSRHTFSQSVLKQAASEILDIVREGLVKDGVVTISKFGSFRLKPVAARRGINPQTGAALIIAAHQRVIFSPCKALRELIEPNHQPPIPIKPETQDPSVTAAMTLQLIETESASATTRPVNETVVVTVAEEPQQNETVMNAAEEMASDSVKSQEIEKTSNVEQQESGQEIDLGVFEPDKRTTPRRHGIWGVLALLLVMAVIAFLLMRRGTPDESSPPPVNVASLSSDTATQTTQPHAEQQPEIAEQPQTSRTPEEKLYFSGQHHHVSRGESLWQLAENYYHQPLLWPHIFQANRDSITDPDRIGVGADILIPTLHGTPDKLSEEDQKSLAEGYRLLYNFYRAQSRPDAYYALLMAKQYEQGVM